MRRDPQGLRSSKRRQRGSDRDELSCVGSGGFPKSLHCHGLQPSALAWRSLCPADLLLSQNDHLEVCDRFPTARQPVFGQKASPSRIHASAVSTSSWSPA